MEWILMRDCLSVMYEVNQSRARLVIPIVESLCVSMVYGSMVVDCIESR